MAGLGCTMGNPSHGYIMVDVAMDINIEMTVDVIVDVA
jgi:hypothetical protein